MGTIAEGVRQAVENCLKVKSGDRVVIITDKETMDIGEALRKGVEKFTGDIQFFVMEDFGPAADSLPAGDCRRPQGGRRQHLRRPGRQGRAGDLPPADAQDD